MEVNQNTLGLSITISGLVNLWLIKTKNNIGDKSYPKQWRRFKTYCCSAKIFSEHLCNRILGKQVHF